MGLMDLQCENDMHLRQAAELLVDNFDGEWKTFSSAMEVVVKSLNEHKISRVAVDDHNNVIGWIGGIRQYGGNVWEMHPLVVDKHHQKQGIGTLLVKDFEDRVREKGGMTILLGTDDESGQTTLGGVDIYPDLYGKLHSIQNLSQHPFAFYQKLGYAIVGVIPDANGFGKPDILMAKRVKELKE